jgi:YcxB-like protein
VSIELNYTAHRIEIWRWYWKTWPKTFLRVHFALVTSIFFWFILLRGTTPIEIAVTRGFLLSAVAIAALVIYPQLMFKPHARTLVVDEGGVSTKIGRRSAHRKWRDISSIVEDGGYIVMATKGGAFIVPPRAFSTDVERTGFLNYVTDIKAAAANRAR